MKEKRQELRNKGFYKIGYSRILTNKMTIVAWRLFKKDRRMHFGLILYRMKRDFGFTEWELANFTGMPVRDIHKMLEIALAFMRTDVLKEIAKFDFEEAEDEWRSLPAYGKTQGYYTIKNYPAWYTESDRAKRFRKPPDLPLGGETEKELNERIS